MSSQTQLAAEGYKKLKKIFLGIELCQSEGTLAKLVASPKRHSCEGRNLKNTSPLPQTLVRWSPYHPHSCEGRNLKNNMHQFIFPIFTSSN